jgi:hypothetical protein
MLHCKNEKLCSPFAAMTGVVTLFFCKQKATKAQCHLTKPTKLLQLDFGA